MMVKRINVVCVVLLFLLQVSPVDASPWLEASDPYLRSDLQFLADTGVLTVPTNSFPVRWSLVGDQFSQLDTSTLTPAQLLAFRHVQYMLDSARLGRGRSHLTMEAANQPQSYPSGFAGNMRNKYQITASHEITERAFSMRLSSGYRDSQDSNDRVSFDDSYFAVAKDDLSISIGWMERWWGPGWQHALGFSQSSEPIPALAMSYLNPGSPLLGSLWFEGLLGKQDNGQSDDYLAAMRLAFKPAAWLQAGMSQKSWWGGDAEKNKAEEAFSALLADSHATLFTADLRLSAPLPGEGAGGLYGEKAWLKGDAANYWLTGVDAQWLINKQVVRFVVEYTSRLGDGRSRDTEYQQLWEQRYRPAVDAEPGSRLSIGQYWQFSNDQQLSFFAHQQKFDTSDSVWLASARYQFAALKGRVTLAADKNVAINDYHQYTFGTRYEYRF